MVKSRGTMVKITGHYGKYVEVVPVYEKITCDCGVNWHYGKMVPRTIPYAALVGNIQGIAIGSTIIYNLLCKFSIHHQYHYLTHSPD